MIAKRIVILDKCDCYILSESTSETWKPMTHQGTSRKDTTYVIIGMKWYCQDKDTKWTDVTLLRPQSTWFLTFLLFWNPWWFDLVPPFPEGLMWRQIIDVVILSSKSRLSLLLHSPYCWWEFTTTLYTLLHDSL